MLLVRLQDINKGQKAPQKNKTYVATTSKDCGKLQYIIFGGYRYALILEFAYLIAMHEGF